MRLHIQVLCFILYSATMCRALPTEATDGAVAEKPNWREDTRPIPAEMYEDIKIILEMLNSVEPWDHL